MEDKSLTKLGVGIMFVLAAIAVGSAVYTNTNGVSNTDVLLMIKNNPPQEHEHDVEMHTHDGELVLKSDYDQFVTNMETAIVGLKTRDNSLDAKINERMMPTGTNNIPGESNFRLEINDNSLQVGDAFKVEGFDKANTPFVASMVNQAGDVMPLNGQTRSNGEFTLDLFIPNSWSAGVYTVTVIIGENFDKLVFTVGP